MYFMNVIGSKSLADNDHHFGVCPECHKNDGFINAGCSHWFYCKEHKTRWRFGSNLFSCWRDETEDEQRRIWDALGFDEFKEIEEYYPLWEQEAYRGDQIEFHDENATD